MLTSRLLPNVKFLSEFILYCSYSSNGKSNVIKILNSENKYMYGNLLETQQQRRKKITKAVENVSDNGNILNPNSSETVAENVTGYEHAENVCCHQETPKTQRKTPKITKKRSKTDGGNDNLKKDKNLSELSSDEFIFKSVVAISEENYPINNPEKNGFFSQDCIVKNVYNYTFNDPAVKHCLRFPSVSKIIEDTMSEQNKLVLEKWRQNMIKDLGEEGFFKHSQDLKSRGQEFHTAVLYTVLGKQIENFSEVTKNALSSLSWMLEQVSNPMAVESVIAHSKLGYKGIPDCVALFRNIPVVIDWKLSDKPKKDIKDTYDAPVQVTAYIGAMNHDPNYKWGVNHGLVAVAYTNGDPCDVFLLAPKHCQIYWRHWLLRLEKFKARSHLHLDHEIDEKALQLR